MTVTKYLIVHLNLFLVAEPGTGCILLDRGLCGLYLLNSLELLFFNI